MYFWVTNCVIAPRVSLLLDRIPWGNFSNPFGHVRVQNFDHSGSRAGVIFRDIWKLRRWDQIVYVVPQALPRALFEIYWIFKNIIPLAVPCPFFPQSSTPSLLLLSHCLPPNSSLNIPLHIPTILTYGI